MSRPETQKSHETEAFRADPVAVYAFVDRFFEVLEGSGVEAVCISPGSRSTPLAIAADRRPGLRTFIGLDERATSFFALGIAKASRRPVAMVCTSGTAAANYLPAIIEAHYSRVPLIALTADRPPELRDWGAGQTIEQPGLYGCYPRWTAEVAMAPGGDDGLRYAARLAARSVDHACGNPAGPVHLNWPFREPLAPIIATELPERREENAASTGETPLFSRAISVAHDDDIDALVALARSEERGVVCAGPMDAEPELVSALLDFARVAGWPVLADPASQIRGRADLAGSPVLALGDGILRAPGFTSRFRPDVVLRVGETPVSKAQRLWIESSAPASVWWLDEGSNWGEPSHRFTRVIHGGATSLLKRAAERLCDLGGRERSWCRSFESIERTARKSLDAFLLDSANFSGLHVAAGCARALATDDTLFASNSMSIRYFDLVHAASDEAIRVLVSRGASGIDGMTSTALGVASVVKGRTLLLTGDLAFLHDLSGLLITKQVALDCVIVVVDDDGGGIFSFLPVAEQGEKVSFERLFGTAHHVDLARVAALYDLGYARASDAAELDAAIATGFDRGGVQLVHVALDRKQNEHLFREALARIVAAVDAEVGQ